MLNQSLYLPRISEEVYVNAMKEEINKVVKLQEELDIDVLVHGEPEVSPLDRMLIHSYRPCFCCKRRVFDS